MVDKIPLLRILTEKLGSSFIFSGLNKSNSCENIFGDLSSNEISQLLNSNDEAEILDMLEEFASNEDFNQYSFDNTRGYNPVGLANISNSPNSTRGYNPVGLANISNSPSSSNRSYHPVGLADITGSTNNSTNSEIAYRSVGLADLQNLPPADKTSSTYQTGSTTGASATSSVDLSGSTYNAANGSLKDFLLEQGYDAKVGNHLASHALNVINDNGMCLRGVSNTIAHAFPGEDLAGMASAYMAIEALRGNRPGYEDTAARFKEVVVSADQLVNLPAGCIVVWNKDADSEHGHISISLGDGRESSDHINNQYTHISDEVHVFIPV